MSSTPPTFGEAVEVINSWQNLKNELTITSHRLKLKRLRSEYCLSFLRAHLYNTVMYNASFSYCHYCVNIFTKRFFIVVIDGDVYIETFTVHMPIFVRGGVSYECISAWASSTWLSWIKFFIFTMSKDMAGKSQRRSAGDHCVEVKRILNRHKFEK